MWIAVIHLEEDMVNEEVFHEKEQLALYLIDFGHLVSEIIEVRVEAVRKYRHECWMCGSNRDIRMDGLCYNCTDFPS
jgi:hypothetical protein